MAQNLQNHEKLIKEMENEHEIRMSQINQQTIQIQENNFTTNK